MTKKIIAVMALVSLALAGCSQSFDAPSETMPPGNMSFAPISPDEAAAWKTQVLDEETYEPHGDLLVKGEKVILLLDGSSSCPPEVKEINRKESFLTVTLESPEANRACTADIREYGWKAQIPASEAGHLGAGKIIQAGNIKPLTFSRLPTNVP